MASTILRASLSAVATMARAETKDPLTETFDAVIVGGGHNGLVAACYLGKAGKSVCVVEKRNMLGGAAVTEEIVPGFKFSRASYLLSLFRPRIISELKMKENGLEYYMKSPSSFTPTRSGKALILGASMEENKKQIAQFSHKDAEAYPRYEAWMSRILDVLDPLIDEEPPSNNNSLLQKVRKSYQMLKIIYSLGYTDGIQLYHLMTAPIEKVLNKWFESEPLKATLATDACIGACVGPSTANTGYVLLHHVMGNIDGHRGGWAFVKGGMGSVSDCLAKIAEQNSVTLRTNSDVSSILVEDGEAKGVVLKDGSVIRAKVVFANPTPQVTFLKLLDKKHLPPAFLQEVKSIDYDSPVCKINVALKELPNYKHIPNRPDNQPQPHHKTTIHINSETMAQMNQGFKEYESGNWTTNPMIEMTIPSSVDPTIAPPGQHVALLFTQYVPYNLPGGKPWDDKARKQYADAVFAAVEQHFPGFKASIVDYEVLSPSDIEATFGLTGGNIFHGSMSLDQLFFSRPVPSFSNYRTPLKGLYLCGSGAHPGGGVTGGPGRLAALAALKDNLF